MRRLTTNGKRVRKALPPHVRPFFWDGQFRDLTLAADADFIIGRLLAEGDWESIKWLRRKVGDRALREWLIRHSGLGLAPQSLRFWELVLGLDRRKVNTWITQQRESPWQRRAGA